jgi:hypothetical protein
VSAVGNLRDATARALSFILPRVEQPLWRVFREDRLLFWCTVGLWVAALIPLLFTPFLPFSDLGNTIAAASLMGDAARGHGAAAEYFRVNWVPTPYFTTYAVLAVVGGILGPLAACKLVTAIILILIPLGVMRLLVTLRRSPRLGLWAFLIGYDHNLFAGWVSLLVGIGLCFFVIAWTLEARTVREALRVALGAALVGLTHIQAVWLLMAAVPLTFPFSRPLRQRFIVHLISGSGLAVTVLPWLASRLGTRSGTPISSVFSFEWHTPDYKISQVFAYTMDNFVKLPSVRLSAFAFLLLTLGPLCLSLMPRRGTGDRNATPLALIAGSVALYAFLWMTIDGPMTHWYTYPRYATVTLLLLLLVPTPRLDGKWALALLPGILTVLAMDWEVGRQMWAFGERTRPLKQVIAAVKPQASVLPLVFDDSVADPELKLPPYHQLTSYIAAFHKGFMPDMWDYPGWPVVYRDEKRKPWPGWDDAGMKAFTMQAYGQYYDYVVVQGFDRADPLFPLQNGPAPRPQLVVEAGRWRLYQMVR